MKSKIKFVLRMGIALLSLIQFYLISACGSAVVTNPGNALPEAPQLGEVVKQAFNLPTSPSDIDIVDIPGLKNIAFVTTATGVLAIDLNLNPLGLSSSVVGLLNLPVASGIGYLSNLEIIDSTHALLLSSNTPSLNNPGNVGKLIFFNPTSGEIYTIKDLGFTIIPGSPLQKRKADGSIIQTTDAFIPTYPADVVVIGTRIGVSFSNLYYYDPEGTSALQGLVVFFDIQNNNTISSPIDYVVTSGFNATGITSFPNGKILVTSSGFLEFTQNNQIPLTNGFVDIINPFTGVSEQNLNLGLTAPSYRNWAISPDNSRAYIGSASGSFVLEIGFTNGLTLTRGLSNPIVVTSGQLDTDYITDVLMSRDGGGLFAFSFNHSSVYAFDLTQSEPQLLPTIVDLTLGGGAAGVTGAGPAVFRPGTPGEDFTGFDLFVLTSNPGTMAAIKTY